MSYGKCDCSSYDVFWTHDFFSGSTKDSMVSISLAANPSSAETIVLPVETVASPNPPAEKAPLQEDSCLEHLNWLRWKQGLLGMQLWDDKNSCAEWQAGQDGPNLDWHGQFGQCGEGAQCEAAGQSTCEDALDSYYAEGPGGGHYDIIMGDYQYMSYGKCDCSSYNVFWTHDFFSGSTMDSMVSI